MTWLNHAAFLLCLGVSVLGHGVAEQSRAYWSQLVGQRYELISSPQRFWLRHCPARGAQPRVVTLFKGAGFRLECREELLWHGGHGWSPLCMTPRKNAVFSPRYYRLAVNCELRTRRGAYLLLHRQWQFFT